MAFDSLVTNPGRLRILTALAAEEQGGRQEGRQAFVELRRRTGLTDGNLATHARRLQSAGLVTIEKSIAAGKPLTTLHLTREGREALTSHVAALQSALMPAAITQAPQSRSASRPDSLAESPEDDWVD